MYKDIISLKAKKLKFIAGISKQVTRYKFGKRLTITVLGLLDVNENISFCSAFKFF